MPGDAAGAEQEAEDGDENAEQKTPPGGASNDGPPPAEAGAGAEEGDVSARDPPAFPSAPPPATGPERPPPQTDAGVAEEEAGGHAEWAVRLMQRVFRGYVVRREVCAMLRKMHLRRLPAGRGPRREEPEAGARPTADSVRGLAGAGHPRPTSAGVRGGGSESPPPGPGMARESAWKRLSAGVAVSVLALQARIESEARRADELVAHHRVQTAVGSPVLVDDIACSPALP